MILCLLGGCSCCLRHLDTLNVNVPLLLFNTVFTTLIVTLFVATCVHRALVQRLFTITVFTSTIFFSICAQIATSCLACDDFISLICSNKFVRRTTCRCHSPLVDNLLNNLLLLFNVNLGPHQRLHLPNTILITTPLVNILLLDTILFIETNRNTHNLPVVCAPLTCLGLFACRTLRGAINPHRPMGLTHGRRPINRSVILVVSRDVSNGCLSVGTPFNIRDGLGRTQPNISVFGCNCTTSVTGYDTSAGVALHCNNAHTSCVHVGAALPSV